jgi:hypothetical protein
LIRQAAIEEYLTFHITTDIFLRRLLISFTLRRFHYARALYAFFLSFSFAITLFSAAFAFS